MQKNETIHKGILSIKKHCCPGGILDVGFRRKTSIK
jgi:hypothetical protein